MQDGCTIRNNYSLDLDNIVTGSRIGMMRCSDATLHYFFDGVDQGVACTDIPSGEWSSFLNLPSMDVTAPAVVFKPDLWEILRFHM